MKGISTTIIIFGIILILGLIFVSSKTNLPRACTEEAKQCPDGNYVGRDPYNNCEFRPCPSETTTTTTTTTIDCNNMNPNNCNIDDDCICSMSKCFRGNKDYAERCVKEAGACQMNYCFFAPGESMACTNHICQIGKATNLDDLVKNPASYVGSYIDVRGQVVKNVGAFFGDTYYFQSNEGIRNFKSLSESSTGIAIVSDNIDLEDYVGYTFNGTGYTIAPMRFFYVDVSGYLRDRGTVTDAARYVLVVDYILDHKME